MYTSSQQKTIYERDAGMCTLINQSINTCKVLIPVKVIVYTGFSSDSCAIFFIDFPGEHFSYDLDNILYCLTLCGAYSSCPLRILIFLTLKFNG